MLSLDIPGSRPPPIIAGVSDRLSRVLLIAADPNPRSDVCLNQAGSFDPRDCEIWFLDMPSSFVGASVAIVAGDLEALFSEAARDNGRLLEPVDPRDEGRCCHGSVPAREGVNAVLESGWEIDWGCDGGCGSSRCKASDPRAPFVLRGISSKPEESIDDD